VLLYNQSLEKGKFQLLSLTERQQYALECRATTKNIREAAIKYGCHRRNYQKILTVIEKKGHKIPSAGMGLEVGQREGFAIKAASTLIKHSDTGSTVVLEWLKQYKHEDFQAWENAVDKIVERLPVAKKIPYKKSKPSELLNLYTITDFHMGMLAYAPETGDDWDTDIARKVLLNAITEMADRAPDAEQGIFCELGDFMHFDSLESITPTGKNLLDSDTRYDRLADTAISTMIDCVEILARKHKKLKVVIAEGNHNLAGSVWVRKCLKHVYKNNPRIEVDDTCFPFYAHLHGKIMLAWHHGHKVKNKSLPALFSSEPRYRKMYGDALYTYIHTGHTHQKEQDASEYGGAIVERHQTLAARDAYATRGGYVSQRSADCITYHSEKGEWARVTVYPNDKE
jgi:hypothetical protein